MKIFNSLEEIKGISPTVVALGNFDGVHKGHRYLITSAVEKAQELGLKSAVFTFSNHPRNLLAGRTVVKNILYNGEKERIIESLGVDYLFNIEFTWDICNMKPEEFIEELLVDKFRMKYAFCGFNYSFGAKAEGNPDLLRKIGREKGFELNMMEPFEIGGNLVSSTFIRSLIETGQVDKCRKYMGEYYEISGEVVVGNKLGRTIGFPTSNLVIDESMVTPPNGVYITYCVYNGVKYRVCYKRGGKADNRRIQKECGNPYIQFQQRALRQGNTGAVHSRKPEMRGSSKALGSSAVR